MSRRAINAQRSADNPHWRKPVHALHGGEAPQLVAKSADELAAETVRRGADDIDNLKRENAALREENERLRAGAPHRAPTQDEILSAIAGAINVKRVQSDMAAASAPRATFGVSNVIAHPRAKPALSTRAKKSSAHKGAKKRR